MISVLMLTYNREALVSRAIESILAQTYKNFEFVIVDNGSTDQSGQIADGYAARDPRIRVIHRERGNIGAGRNTGLDAAQGEYVAFIDDDDLIAPMYLEYLYKLTVEHCSDIAVCGSWREINGARQPKYVFDGVFTYNGEDAVVELLKREKFNSANPTKLISAEIFKHVRYNDCGKYDDIIIAYKEFANARKVVVSGVPLYTFVRHDQNNSLGTTQGEAIPSGQVVEYLAAFRERTLWLTERFPDKANYWLYTELSYALSMYDKVNDPPIQAALENLLYKNRAAFQYFKPFFSERDQMLIKKYGGNHVYIK